MLTDITVILDRSGSMSHIKESTIEGFNNFLEDQREEEGDARITLVQFNSEVETLWSDRPLDEAPSLDEGHYIPKGSTALNDAVGEGIQEAKARAARSDQDRETLYVVITDGKENSSREFSHSDIQDMIESERDEGREFIFLAANQNAMATADNYGMDPDKSLTYAHSDEGTVKAYTATSRVMSAARSEDAAMSASFTAEEREEQKNVAPEHGIAKKAHSADDLNFDGEDGPDKNDNAWNSDVNAEIHTGGPSGKEIALGNTTSETLSHVTPDDLAGLSNENEQSVMKSMMEYHQGNISLDEARRQINEIDPNLLPDE